MRFASVTIGSPRPEALLASYEAMGFEREGDALLLGATRLRVRPRPPAGPVHLALNVPFARFDDALAWLRGHATPLEADGEAIVPYPSWDAIACYWRDLDGNVLELIGRRRLAGAFHGPFGARGVERVSEVGVPVADVRGTAQALARDVEAPVFDGPSETFAAVGDEEGLVILVKEGRAWFPTLDATAAAAPLAVALEGGARLPLGREA